MQSIIYTYMYMIPKNVHHLYIYIYIVTAIKMFNYIYDIYPNKQ